MNLLNKTWFKILLSLILAAVISEIISIKTVKEPDNTVIILAAIIFIIISLFNWIYYYRIYQSNAKNDSKNEDV